MSLQIVEEIVFLFGEEKENQSKIPTTPGEKILEEGKST
jgi:hypothetical protein